MKSMVLSLAVVGFILVMVLLYLWLKREPDQQHKTQPDRPQSSSVVRVTENAPA